MNLKSKYWSLIIWVVAIGFIGSLIGSVTKPEISGWYSIINRSSLTPPNFVFPIAWSILYVCIAIAGWLIWSNSSNHNINLIKGCYIFQLVLNWSWTPLFFHYHFTGISLVVLLLMDAIVAILICLSYKKLKIASWLLMPYLMWIIFASYLNLFIWINN